MLLIPAIDLRAGRCVRLLQGDFAAETRYEVEPEALLVRYRELGASWLHVVDLDGARNGIAENRGLIHRMAAVGGIRLQTGGGVRSAADIDDLLRHGVARVVIGSAAIEQPERVADWLARFGADNLCLAFDVRVDREGVPRVSTRGWTEGTRTSLWDAVDRFAPNRLRHVLCTDIERDGTLSGPNLSLYAEAVGRMPHIAWQASGGVRNSGDLADLARSGVDASISGKALLEERITSQELKPFLYGASFPASTSATPR